jgi:hypothetical protein
MKAGFALEQNELVVTERSDRNHTGMMRRTWCRRYCGKDSLLFAAGDALS